MLYFCENKKNQITIMTQQNQHDEIDLFDLFSRIGKIFKNLFNSIINILLIMLGFCLRKFWYLLALVIISSGLSLVYYKMSVDPYYENSMILKSNLKENKQILHYINNLNKNADKTKTLMDAFSIDSIQASKIQSIEAFWFIDQNNDKIPDYIDFNDEFYSLNDTTPKLTNNIYLTLKYTDNDILTKVRKGLLKYINNKPFMNELSSNKKQQLENLKEKLKLELNELDSMQKTYIENLNFSKEALNKNGQIMFLNEKDIKLFHSDIILLQNQIHSYEKQLLLETEVVTILEDFTPYNEPVKSYIDYNIRFNLVILAFGVIILLIVDQRKRFFKAIKEIKAKR